MRYIYTILIILLIVSVVAIYELNKKEKIQEDAAIIINKKVIKRDEFEKLYSLQPSYLKDRQEFINTLITKELLIQESQKEGIDKEESFRRSLQNYYEQSLIKLLMDRKFSSLEIGVNEREINKYATFMDKKIRLVFYYYKSIDDIENNKVYEVERVVSDFSNLSQDVRCSLIYIDKGEVTKPIKIGERYAVIRIEGVEPATSRVKQQMNIDEIRRAIVEFKRQQMINDWILSLRKKADVKIYVNNN